MDKILSGRPAEINFDQVRQPLFVDDVAMMIKLINAKGESGIFHLAGPDRSSKYDLAKRLEQIVRPNSESKMVAIPEVRQVARRPKDVSIRTDKTIALGIKFTPLETALRQIEGQYRQSVEGRKKPLERN